MKNFIYIVAGGTGGHISPGIAIAEKLHSRGENVVFLSLDRNREYPDLAKENPFPVEYYQAPRLSLSLKNLVKLPFTMLKAIRHVSRLARKYPAKAMVGMGGYPTFPALWWARRKKIPYYLCEQNVHHGRVTRLMGGRARAVFLSFPQQSYLANQVLTGNPLRPIFKTRPAAPKKIKNILLIGGSQGARDICSLYLELIKRPAFQAIKATIATGQNQYDEVQSQARPSDEVFSFITDMPGALAKSDLVISRAGAGLVFEILWSRRPSILLPYPYAADDHQKANALKLAEKELAHIIDERPFSPAKAALQVESVLAEFNPAKWAASEKANSFGLDAATAISDYIGQG